MADIPYAFFDINWRQKASIGPLQGSINIVVFRDSEDLNSDFLVMAWA